MKLCIQNINGKKNLQRLKKKNLHDPVDLQTKLKKVVFEMWQCYNKTTSYTEKKNLTY